MKVLIVEDQFIEAYDLQLTLERNGHSVTGIAASAQEAMASIEKNTPDLVCLDIFIKGAVNGIELAETLQALGIGFVFISANSGKTILDRAKVTNPYGFIIKPFREEDILTTIEIAGYRHNHKQEQLWEQRTNLQQRLNALDTSGKVLSEKLVQTGAVLQSYYPFDYLELGFNETGIKQALLRKGFSEYRFLSHNELPEINKPNPKSHSNLFENGGHDIYTGQAFTALCRSSARCRYIAETFGIRSLIVLTGTIAKSSFSLLICSRQPDYYNKQHVIMNDVVTAYFEKLFNARDLELTPVNKVSPKKQLTAHRHITGAFVGTNSKMLSVYDAATRVAPSDTSVLILGENGTGKEHVARYIHKLSSRAEKSFVAVNCAAIPANLAESILFGHEKGAFTGANERHIGKFELAENGTIFLDEIGEMPIELQVKLLRVLQENEIERVGGQKPIKINARIIAATNKNLEEEVSTGRFRIDLFYRLYVFPVNIPPLRERTEDIINLAGYFIEGYCKKLNRGLMKLSAAAAEQLIKYSWPGNVRQLEHAIQRAIIMTDGEIINELPLPKTTVTGHTALQEFAIDSVKTIQEMERDYIYHILKKCQGKVYGTGGAAELLNLPPSTLNSKMKKLGISSKFI
ncbi:hypothetical protein AM493_01340 [Flavobacterium akiainvivens]|uniref:Fis family transcriptional regulator n=1 Tax=Flavobacterium akiainvivens TaxID=1202724 RepID=A0A0M8MFR4_9FLAO|nr:sigma 54-interacting response regulator [Flavobacterium akiainvivens]KOS04837.1 hypothetical protein AM493_01340 [Flavobacterium akiainvivens]SFQ43466.1 formate hydrogenlyase transcriptional activator [Flavobacterium akiainvivens]